MKKNDAILLIAFLLLALVLFLFMKTGRETGAYAVVSIGGKETGHYSLRSPGRIQLQGENSVCTLVIENGEIYMEEAGCTDHSCVRQGRISKTGEQIICLPNRLVVEIVGEGEQQELDVIVR